MSKKIENFKEMNKGDLSKKITELREALRVLKFKTEGTRSKNVKESLNLKRQIARALTEFNSKK